MDKALTDRIGKLLDLSIENIKPISGGDIAQAFQLTTQSGQFLCKYLQKPEALAMFQSEMDGLDAIRKAGSILTPKVFLCEPFENGAFLVMEFINSKRPTDAEMATFGRQLAQLHSRPAEYFGWKENNYIGSLKQSNQIHDNWAEFYVSERLQPQLELAADNRMLHPSETPSFNKMISVIRELGDFKRSSLLHGDLWSGNFLIAENGSPFLIDPAVYCGHCEVDIAMSRLFGGFSSSFYRAYEDLIPGDPLSNDRIKIYQLYYLLVHLNLFGSSYYSSVSSILKEYFR